MRIRLVPVLVLSLIALGTLAGSSSSATPPPTIGPFLGDWTMVAGADAALVGQHLLITETSASNAQSLVGPEWTNVSGTAWYDTHCGSKVTVYAYVVLQYSWATQGSMGGCLSSATGPHVVFAGSKMEAGSFRIVKSAGQDTLGGTWDTIENHICCVHHVVSGVLPSVSFTVGEQGHVALPKVTNGPKFVLSKLLGLGSVSLGAGTTNSAGVYNAAVDDATGTIHFHKWRVYEHGVIDEDLLVLNAQRADHANYYKDGGLVRINEVGVTVTKSERGETDVCPVGATGTLYLAEVTSGPHKGTDLVELAITQCNVLESFVNGRKGAKVGVGLTYNKP